VFAAALALCSESDPERYAVVQIVEVFLPAGGHKVRTRMSRLSDRQWATVVKRSLDGLDDGESGWPMSVTLIAGEPFDNSDAADELPPNFPKSSLKGISPGPVSVTTMMFPNDSSAVVTIDLSFSARERPSVDGLWPLAVGALSPIAEDPNFELAAIRTAPLGSGETFDPDPVDGPVILVCGPATSARRSVDLAASAHSTLDASPVLGLRFAHP